MIFESTEESRDFATRYNVDYGPHVPKKRPQCEWSPHFPHPLNIVNGPYKWHLNTSKNNKSLPFEKRTEDPQDYAYKLGERFPNLKKIIPETLNEQLVEREEKKLARTTYQVQYSKDLDDFLSLRAQKLGTHLKRAVLPEDWVIPETVQKRSFRNPWAIIREDLLKVKRQGLPPNNLDPNLKEREILRVRTGASEYHEAICTKAEMIMREKQFGSPLPIEPPRLSRVNDSDQKSECSSFLAKEQVALPSNVF